MKLSTDVVSAIVSLALLWRHRLGWGIGVALVPPFIASTAILRWASLQSERESRFGR